MIKFFVFVSGSCEPCERLEQSSTGSYTIDVPGLATKVHVDGGVVIICD